ncbi:MAG: bifunctional 2-C-methyl-D-erythritol 4-phosphate cytidylyltransferase/2-C-methyl-D-erythritol 2,4-cyclodiphosphate synthase [Tabrizicola sp.]|uniref:bifunctional 2-C-methyl-D-erythritol 4-phosphate cytidylyltransferase/2-C-methyl-D-erythritol 2,4-cyclodiphosphate synthase n=1 Tax=Tabrizicola sp. TaxID=2005166 RepID=UPI0027353B82|nr:bifunctional 2-C-methyl-D-erythritol 4-phosphate cytidylyltransferase/2-C-methyl-D-erythritol 2,4-cyclodiphosphate synthase [Tabrizicola sp.]MDP3264644.1 bifunctional 2-C-methyl-D-erythritol 4-phosphate cytidylyltransferase/2-C-methyl-D-erythritol 2,4-cyclodiphosphate synthase [Tabrizicola sp.]MDP3647676.1 bifunctional 2-C-methyl-D-erythritol 4-phosphate cytidylyltransferase/2-C-methyl-D-erythritol 2,4-cyclodiphosphate synthase [Paracoccaceae bacterium]MDZ4068405.1 bifunctional 2-C-methyl-D-e
MSIAVIIVAAGRGTRAGGDVPKQWQTLAGQPVLAHTLAAFAGMDVVLAIHPEDRARAEALGTGARLVEGGPTRDASVRAALEALAGSAVTQVLIHDGARPLPSPALIGRLVAALDDHPGAAPALAVTDALWRGEAGLVAGTQDRSGLYRAQTPQAFRFEAILAAHRAHPGGAADDVEVARAAGLDVAIVEGDEQNLKLTFPGDFARGEAILKGRMMDVRLGNGYDVHAFCDGDHVWLCGVKVTHSKGLLGHSDADVGMHALTDAIYGALAEGDIGRHFPPSDPQWKGAASHIFLAHAVHLMTKRGYRLANCDVTLVCERPKIGPHAIAMQGELARIMGVDVGLVSVKATTSERLGFTGREEGIAAIATAALVRA